MLKCVLLIASLVTSSLAVKKIPDHFLLGTGTSAFQVEGAWNEGGKGPSLWDTYLHNQNATENGDVACDSYHKWQEDVANAKALGLDFYRFSISWPRILPNGTLNNINQEGIDYYLNLIQALKAENIEPMVTIYHWDMPQHIYELGGFLNPQFVDYFEDFSRLVYKLYGSYIKYWLTFNEPSLICQGGYGMGIMAPGLLLNGDGIYQCGYVLLKAHARAYRVYDEEFRAQYNGQVGLVVNFQWAEPASNSTLDLEAQERYTEFELGFWVNPIYLGNWPQVMIDRISNRSKLEGLSRSRLPSFTQEEIEYINGTHDFFAINTYGVYQVKYAPEPAISYPSYTFDLGVDIVNDTTYYNPKGVRDMVNYISQKYQPNGIIITENGKPSEDTLEDMDRINLIRDYLGNLIDALVEDKVNVFGYSIWSLMDNFEWGSYKSKFGIIRVDFDSPNRTRTWKESAKWYQNVIATRILDDA
ncbi:unnamed protein product [Ceutorhynchus assimilis]|uniref:Beta-glucosidase n=1 Tax=Ceutorhynchus assimilis TaxID=467358 RepID=A0A9N9MRL1_9CUCU|nr:unnamed protein product [Ceutorhynchus assimilis]